MPQIREGGAWRSPELQEKLVVVCNTDDGLFYANIAAAIKRGLPELQLVPEHDGHAVIVGGGPSLVDTLDELRWRYEQGQTIFALNNTRAWLCERGIIPHYTVLLDARASTARFVGPAIDRTQYLVASQCAEATFDACLALGKIWDAQSPDGRDRVILWHPHVEGIKDYAPTDAVLIGGGTTVGLQTTAIAYTLGFRKLHLYGFDSCYRDDDGHAYAQPENDGEKIIDCTVAGRSFKVAPWMAQQADEFKNVALQLADMDCVVTVAGDGLIPHIANEMARPMDPSAVCYDLAEAPASFDFMTWLVIAEMDRVRRGAPAPLRVAFAPGPKDGFRNDDLPLNAKERQGFLDNVLRPALAFVGAVEDESAVHGRTYFYRFRDVVSACRAGEPVPQFKAPDDAKARMAEILRRRGITKPPLIITLREAAHWPERNSNLAAWCAFAKERHAEGHQIVFVRDTEWADDPLDGFVTIGAAAKDLQLRAALYESAHCNLFVANGPAALCIYSQTPFLMFKSLTPGSAWVPGRPEWWASDGIEVGGQLPWSLSTQRITWTNDDLASINKAWREIGPLLQPLQ
jgi:uncharacterized Rossmann fold enzyme